MKAYQSNVPEHEPNELDDIADNTQAKFTYKEIRLMKMDYNFKQKVKKLQINSKKDVEVAVNYIMQWSLKDDIRYVI